MDSAVLSASSQQQGDRSTVVDLSADGLGAMDVRPAPGRQLVGLHPRLESHSAESARLALRAVMAHADHAHARRLALRDSMADLLTDLMHLSERSGTAFHEVLEAARDAFWADLTNG